MGIMSEMTRDIVYESMDDFSRIAHMHNSRIVDFLEENSKIEFKVYKKDLLYNHKLHKKIFKRMKISWVLHDKLKESFKSRYYEDGHVDGMRYADACDFLYEYIAYGTYGENYKIDVTEEGEYFLISAENTNIKDAYNELVEYAYENTFRQLCNSREINFNKIRKNARKLGIPKEHKIYRITKKTGSYRRHIKDTVRQHAKQEDLSLIKCPKLLKSYIYSYMTALTEGSAWAYKNLSLFNYANNRNLPIYSIKEWIYG